MPRMVWNNASAMQQSGQSSSNREEVSNTSEGHTLIDSSSEGSSDGTINTSGEMSSDGSITDESSSSTTQNRTVSNTDRGTVNTEQEYGEE